MVNRWRSTPYLLEMNASISANKIAGRRGRKGELKHNYNWLKYYRRVRIPRQDNDAAIHFRKWAQWANQANWRQLQAGSVTASSTCPIASWNCVISHRVVVSNEGWRPRRSILFCSWGGSEQGFTGVTEWVEEYITLLGARTVAYLNVDIAVVSSFSLQFPIELLWTLGFLHLSQEYAYNLAISASPVLHQVVIEAANHVEAPNNSSMSLYELWSTRRRFSKELISVSLSSVSDQAPFYQRAGIPCTYMCWMPDPVSQSQ